MSCAIEFADTVDVEIWGVLQRLNRIIQAGSISESYERAEPRPRPCMWRRIEHVPDLEAAQTHTIGSSLWS